MKPLKQGIAMLLSALLCVSTPAFARVEDPGEIPAGDPARFEPYMTSLNTTRYTPWYTMYHMQSEAEQAMGRPAGEGGQIILTIAASPVNPKRMMFGSDMASLWSSHDGGESWFAVSDNINLWTVADIIFHPTEEETVYLVQGSKGAPEKLDATTLDGIYKSIDGGETWEQMKHVKVPTSSSSERVMDFDAAGNLYVLTSEGLLKSADGTEWENLGVVGEGNMSDIDVSDDGMTILTVCDKTGITASFNGGKTWERKNGDFENATATSIAVDPTNDSHYFAVFSGDHKGLYESFDKGETWTSKPYETYASKNTPVKVLFGNPRADGVPGLYLVYREMSYPLRVSFDMGATWHTPKIANTDIATVGTTGYYSEGIWISPNNPDIVFYSFGDIVYKSTDGGLNFEYSNSGFSGNYTNNFVFDDENRIHYAFVDKGLGESTAPYTATGERPAMRMVSGVGSYLTAKTIGSFAQSPHDKNRMLIGLGKWAEQILTESKDGGKTWTQIPGTESKSAYKLIEFHPTDPNTIYTTHLTSYDGGATWQKNEVSIFDVSPVNPDILVGKSGKGVYRSEDKGKTWTKLAETSEPKSMVADAFDANVIWVGCYNGTVAKVDGTTVTTFGEAEGIAKFDGQACLMEAIAQNPKDKNHILAGGRCSASGTKTPGLYETLDGGKTWHVVLGLPCNRLVNSIVFSPVSDEVFLGTYYGVILYEYPKFKQYLNNTLQVDFSDRMPTGKIRVEINGKAVVFDTEPTTINDRTMVPMRKIFEILGAQIAWEDSTQTVTATQNGTTIVLTIGSDTAQLNGEAIQLDAAPTVVDDRTLVPVRFIAQSLGATVDWDEASSTVIITTK